MTSSNSISRRRVASLIFVCAMSAAIVACSAVVGGKLPYGDEGIGLRTETLFSEDGVTTPGAPYRMAPAGSGERLERSFQDAPPLIPHSVEGLLPIKVGSNNCVACHMPPAAAAVKAPSVPTSHMTDLRTGKDLAGKLSNARFNCTQCHAPQAEIDPVVANTFERVFQQEKDRFGSDLMNRYQDGVK